MTDSKHNSIGGQAADQLRAYVNRIERLEEEVTGLNADKSEIYAESKAAGFDKPTLRKLIQRRRKNATDVQEEDALLELYEAAVFVPADPLD
jgi:uncharacterized protein (UPF0335 family)